MTRLPQHAMRKARAVRRAVQLRHPHGPIQKIGMTHSCQSPPLPEVRIVTPPPHCESNGGCCFLQTLDLSVALAGGGGAAIHLWAAIFSRYLLIPEGQQMFAFRSFAHSLTLICASGCTSGCQRVSPPLNTRANGPTGSTTHGPLLPLASLAVPRGSGLCHPMLHRAITESHGNAFCGHNTALGHAPPPPCSTNALATEHFRSDHIFSGTQFIGCQSNWVLNGVSDGHSCSLDCSLDTGGGYNARGSALRMTWKRGGKRHIPPHPAQPRHTNDWAPRTRKRHQQEHRPQRPTERSDPTQRAKGRTGDCPGPP